MKLTITQEPKRGVAELSVLLGFLPLLRHLLIPARRAILVHVMGPFAESLLGGRRALWIWHGWLRHLQLGPASGDAIVILASSSCAASGVSAAGLVSAPLWAAGPDFLFVLSILPRLATWFWVATLAVGLALRLVALLLRTGS